MKSSIVVFILLIVGLTLFNVNLDGEQGTHDNCALEAKRTEDRLVVVQLKDSVGGDSVPLIQNYLSSHASFKGRNTNSTRPANIEGHRRLSIRLNDDVTEPVPYSNSLFVIAELPGYLFEQSSTDRAHSIIIP